MISKSLSPDTERKIWDAVKRADADATDFRSPRANRTLIPGVALPRTLRLDEKRRMPVHTATVAQVEQAIAGGQQGLLPLLEHLRAAHP